MAREIESSNTYKDVLLKLIPSEIVAAYMVVDGFIPADKPYARWVATAASGFLLILTPFYLRKLYKVYSWRQIIFISLSFIVWVYWMGGPFKFWNIHLAWLASIVLVLWTLLVPLVNLPSSKFGEGKSVWIATSKPDIVEGPIAIVWNQGMNKYLGRTAHVSQLDEKRRAVRLDIDEGQYWWSFDWLRPKRWWRWKKLNREN